MGRRFTVIVDGAPAESGESGLSITGLVGVKSIVLMAALGEADGDTHAEAGEGVGVPVGAGFEV
jgi:hypothetical protein